MVIFNTDVFLLWSSLDCFNIVGFRWYSIVFTLLFLHHCFYLGLGRVTGVFHLWKLDDLTLCNFNIKRRPLIRLCLSMPESAVGLLHLNGLFLLLTLELSVSYIDLDSLEPNFLINC